MQNKSVAIILLAALMLVSCKAWSGSERSGAEFRALARIMYSSLEMPSCDTLKGFNRRDHLTNEWSAVGKFEAQIRATSAWGHLEVAREDARYTVMQDEGCWSDPSRRWAQLHLKMTKDEVKATLPQLTALVSSLRELPAEAQDEPSKMAEFRYLARQLLTDVTPLCALTASASVSDEEVLRPALDAIANLEDEVADTRFAVHFVIAEADVAYEMSQTVVECARPSTADPKQVGRKIAVEAERQIEAIRKIVRVP